MLLRALRRPVVAARAGQGGGAGEEGAEWEEEGVLEASAELGLQARRRVRSLPTHSHQ